MVEGVDVNEEVATIYQEILSSHKYNWVTFEISDDKKYVKLSKKSQDSTSSASYADAKQAWETFIKNELPDDEPRYAVYEIKVDQPDGNFKTAIVFIGWYPETSWRIRSKSILYSGAEDSVKKKLESRFNLCKGTNKDDLYAAFATMAP